MSSNSSNNNAMEFALLALLALLWGSSYLFIKIAVTDIPPLTLIAVRVTIAALVLLVIMLWHDEKLPRDHTTWRLLFVQAFFTSTGAWTLLAWGQQKIDSGLASVLNSTSPIFVFFFTLLVTRHETVSWLKFIGGCLGLSGVVMIVGVDVLHGVGHQVTGQLAALGGAILYACAAIYGRRFSAMEPVTVATGTMLCATACLVPLSLIIDRPWTLTPSTQSVLAALFLAVFCTGIALQIYFRLINTLGSMGVASQAYLRAGVGVLLGMIFLGEQFTLIIGFGLAAAILGVAAINLPFGRR
ncbi:MAG: EamA family transporter [Stappiaceae bacterium]